MAQSTSGLRRVCPDTYREAAPESLSRYVVWGQNDTAALYGDDSVVLAPWIVACQVSFVHGISQARILEWAAISFSRGSAQSRDRTHISCIGRRILYH